MATKTTAKQGESASKRKTTRGTLAAETIARQDAERKEAEEAAAKGDKGKSKRLVALVNIPPHKNRGVRVWKGQEYQTGVHEGRVHVSGKLAKEA